MYKIGYYVNNHGTGHTNRLFCFIKQLETLNLNYKLFIFAEDLNKIVNLGFSLDKIELVQLGKPNWSLEKKHMIFHSLPKNYKQYFKPIVETCIKESIQTFVSDLSVEVGIAVRLHVDRLVYILLHGERIDDAHQAIFFESDILIVPFSEVLEDWYLKDFKLDFNLVYSGGFLKFQYQTQPEFFPKDYSKEKKNILIILGTGGDNFNKDYIDVDTNEYNVIVLGKDRFENPYNYIRCADVVVANAGDSILHEIAYFNKPYICIPENRPFAEQEIKADTLEREGFALISNWNYSLKDDLENLKQQKDKGVLIQNDKARLFTQQVLGFKR